jgi:hypothetical protein
MARLGGRREPPRPDDGIARDTAVPRTLKSTAVRAIKSFRLAPRSFVRTLGASSGVGPSDAEDARRFVDMFQPVLLPSGGAGHLVVLSYLPLRFTNKIECLLARALQERGWKVSVVANQSTEGLAREYFGRALGADVVRIEDFLDFGRSGEVDRFVENALAVARADIAALKAVSYRSAPLGLSVMASLTAARPDGTIGRDSATRALLRRLLRQSALLFDAADALYEALRPSLALCQEKGFVGTCETFHAALRRDLDYVQWVSCHAPESVMFKRFTRDNARDHPFSISGSQWDRLSRTPWSDMYRDAVMAEFDRGYRSGDWFRYKKLSGSQTFADREAMMARLGLDRGKRTAVIYSHILNDANLFYGTDLFSGGYEEWLVETVRAAAANPRVNWVLKLHPANVARNARIGYTGEYGELMALKRAFGAVPGFLTIVRPEETMSPLSFFGITDWGITVRGTIGLELPCFGIPVLTAGSGRYSGKGFTIDSATAAEYAELVRAIDSIEPLGERQVRLAILHAYFVLRGRPARYGGVLRDIHPDAPGSQRDLEPLRASLDEIVGHEQLRAMADYLAGGRDDFIDPAIDATAEAA